MKPLVRRALQVASVWLCSDPAWGHVGDRIYPILELSDAEVELIDVHDGVVTDWQDAVGPPTLTIEDFGEQPSSSLDFRIWLGWHRRSSRLYVAMERIDDVFLNRFTGGRTGGGTTPRALGDMEVNDSYLHVAVDVQHTGDEGQTYICADPEGDRAYDCLRRQSASTQRYGLLGVTAASGAAHLRLLSHWNYDRGHPSFALYPPYGDGGGAVFSENPFISVTEGYVTLFEYLDYREELVSRPAVLEPGKIIGFMLSTNDMDHPSMEWKPEITLAGAHPFGPLADGLLLERMSAIEQGEEVTVDSWARIKAASATLGTGPHCALRAG